MIPRQVHDVELFASDIGIGVRAVDTLHVGSTVAPYTGILTNHDYNTDANQHEYVVALQARARGRVKNKLYIDAEEWGTVARFINHSCEPNTEFVEMRHNREVHVMVKATKEINAGVEATVDYGDTWFPHACKTANCRDKIAG
ncbi:SET domain-containing protein [Phytophthora infestans]|uniref:SET domain-containing protein n=1 Tax=Phytophthora infestans TaxID=4787 RepID=A0A8S9UR27_PHYIN|nr:SET domain-containing protein [Phytophthora infestans]